ncbi:ankyrin repeat-containing domain protein [Tuber borchii]|uniref:Ankyrin repeat-containing domain protein n=1 Tax=Tuber borchii TaxID=42251 RepID=A0A2T7A6N2_TUBBO|nr:ankyrin repeat-containing domain protein [Tuber borchii]
MRRSTPLSYAVRYGHEGIVKILLGRGDINSDFSDKYNRTPLSLAAEYGHEGIVKILLERGDVNSDSLDNDGRTPLEHAQKSSKLGVVKLLSEPKPLSHKTPPTRGMNPKIPGSALSAQVEASDLLPQQDCIIPTIRRDIIEVIPLSPSDESPLNQHGVDSSAPILTSAATFDTTPVSTILNPSRPPKRDRVTPPPFPPAKRPRLPPS